MTDAQKVETTLRIEEKLPKNARNTPLARKMAGILKRDFNFDFPGGPENAFILYSGSTQFEKECGACTFSLRRLDNLWWNEIALGYEIPGKCTKAVRYSEDNFYSIL